MARRAPTPWPGQSWRPAVRSNAHAVHVRSLSLALALGAGLALTPHALAQGIENPFVDPIAKSAIRIELQTVASGMSAPIWATNAPGSPNRLYVADQAGQLRVIDNGSLLPAPMLDLSSRLVTLGVLGTHDENDYDERGFLGMAFHPEFDTVGAAGFRKFYTYTSEPVDALKGSTFTTATPPPSGLAHDHQSVVREWSALPGDPTQADPTSGRELMRIDQPQFNHNGGALAFGPDGMMYVSLGDGGGADDQDGEPFFGGTVWGHGVGGAAQNMDVVHGKVLRIDPLGNNAANGQYGVPADNPNVGSAGVDEIWASGFRNPFRMSFDSATGDLYVADVGQNKVEEIDVVTRGGNYGWGLMEGSFKFEPNGTDPGYITDDLSGLPPGLLLPIGEYDHDEGIAVVGGFVYHGSALPDLVGKYVFGDFSRDFGPTGRLFVMDTLTGLIEELTLGLDDRSLGMYLKGFGQDASGEIYVLAGTNLGPAGDQGLVLRIVAVPAPGTLALLGAACVLARRRRVASA